MSSTPESQAPAPTPAVADAAKNFFASLMRKPKTEALATETAEVSQAPVDTAVEGTAPAAEEAPAAIDTAAPVEHKETPPAEKEPKPAEEEPKLPIEEQEEPKPAEKKDKRRTFDFSFIRMKKPEAPKSTTATAEEPIPEETAAEETPAQSDDVAPLVVPTPTPIIIIEEAKPVEEEEPKPAVEEVKPAEKKDKRRTFDLSFIRKKKPEAPKSTMVEENTSVAEKPADVPETESEHIQVQVSVKIDIETQTDDAPESAPATTSAKESEFASALAPIVKETSPAAETKPVSPVHNIFSFLIKKPHAAAYTATDATKETTAAVEETPATVEETAVTTATEEATGVAEKPADVQNTESEHIHVEVRLKIDIETQTDDAPESAPATTSAKESEFASALAPIVKETSPAAETKPVSPARNIFSFLIKKPRAVAHTATDAVEETTATVEETTATVEETTASVEEKVSDVQEAEPEPIAKEAELTIETKPTEALAPALTSGMLPTATEPATAPVSGGVKSVDSPMTPDRIMQSFSFKSLFSRKTEN